MSPVLRSEAIERGDILRSTFINLREVGFNRMSLRSEDVIKFGRELYRVTIVEDTVCPNFKWLRRMKEQLELIEGTCRICLCA
jgi:hypothetical protein